jgi:membrane protease YdiL (CAAX protease family)
VDLLVVGLVLLLFGFLAWSNLQVGDVKPQQIRPVGLVVSMLMQGMIAGMLVMCVWVRYPLVEWLGLRWPKWRSVFWQTPLALFAVWALMIAVSLSGYLDWLTGLGVETSQDSVRLLKESDDPAVLALMAVAAVLVAPVCEEVVFRGYLYPAMKHHSGPVCAAMVSALVFSAAHGSLAAILPLFILGLVFVWLYEKSGSIWAPIALHFAFNSATVLLQFLIRWLHLPIQTP